MKFFFYLAQLISAAHEILIQRLLQKKPKGQKAALLTLSVVSPHPSSVHESK